jgi:hypothetical protein
MEMKVMTQDNNNLLNRFPPGFASHRYRLTPEEIERKRQWNRIHFERDDAHRRKLIEEGKLPPDNESLEKPA